MKTADYDYLLPQDLIARRPLEKRDSSRLLVLHKDGHIEHRKFCELPLFLNPGDILLINNSKVFPARLTGRKNTGGKLEILLVRETSPGLWDILSRESYTGDLKFPGNLSAYISDGKTACFENRADLKCYIWEEGKMPLPPYIKREPDETDKQRYQTVYAEIEGSIAAPTAGLHFTNELLAAIASKSVLLRSVTLHVGTGTFKPVRTTEVDSHKMDAEFFEMDSGLIKEIQEARESRKKIFTVGTTTTRALEGYLSGRCNTFSANGAVRGTTDIFIYEGYRFRAVDSLITNFHLPRSTPLMLTAALAGRKNLLKAYESAIAMGYRFFSYGDAMLVL
ncbi:MAG: tRNA preQ1(34) S-adenosylmethionine ribosyltransferase-isomerase QueA [Nitrospirota bacterium]